MISLESQRKEFNIVISDITRCKNRYSFLLDYLSENGITYYAIVHDSDINITTGETIRPHLHIVTRSLKRYRVKQMLNMISEILVTNVENVQIMECDNITACIQYLIHKNNLEKYQYDAKDIITNDNDNLIPILNETIKIEAVTTDRLIEMVSRGDTLLEIIQAIGIGSYTHYRQTIRDLLEIFRK